MTVNKAIDGMRNATDSYGENVFSIKAMRNYLSDSAFKSLKATIREGKMLDASIADDVAEAMKTWAIEKGATHFTHWFQPLTGATAEKHDSFVVPDRDGGVIMQFSGKELIKGEPDASSFPSGGLRATFEARGYTAWDPTSPAFIKESKNAAVLCVPTVFYSYTGEALDKKVPLLRSIDALSSQICRVAKLFDIENTGAKPSVQLGPEQEYFLVDRKYFEKRPDLIQTGRTLFGLRSAKDQQMSDHYFGPIKRRVTEFMCELDKEMWRLGVPAKTRHNEVCPGQFELAPIFEELNLAIDHNMIMMEVMQDIAEKHGLVCLLHEKPFTSVNGSGKHNNWSVSGPDGKNWLKPGDSPHENAKFLTVLCAVIKGVDTHAPLLRASVASAGNDHRLGGHEAPPAIMSIFLGEQLNDIVRDLENGDGKASKKRDTIEIGVSPLPPLPKDTTDRNRTSPLAYTGNKFEFRAVGSSQNSSGPNVVMNTIVAEALDEICTKVETDIAGGKDLNESLQLVLRDIVKKHKRVLFDGDNYKTDWTTEAEKRGLPNLRKTPEALKALLTPEAGALFEKYGVLTKRELASRYEVYQTIYDETIAIESRCSLMIARTMIAPVALAYQGELADIIKNVERIDNEDMLDVRELLSGVRKESSELLKGIKKLQKYVDDGASDKAIDAMTELRAAADALEGMLPKSDWPMPSYGEMMFML